MSYKDINYKNIVENTVKRKEFFTLKPIKEKKFNIAGFIKNEQIKELSDDIIPRYMLEKEIKQGNFLQLHSYQIFIKNFINPNTSYKRMLIKWETGTGKTIGAISLAMNFINYYQKETEKGSLQIGTVFIIGFSRIVFKRELLKETIKVITGPRAKDYGDKYINHANISELWSSYLVYKISPHDVAICMALVKIARLKNRRTKEKVDCL